MSDENDSTNLSKSNLQAESSGLKKKLSQMIEDLNFDVQNEMDKSGINPVEVALTNDERIFLLSVEGGDVATAKMMMDNQSKYTMNVNRTDPLGRNALQIAIENEHMEMLAMLLDYNLEIGDSLLHAISDESVEAVEIILNTMAQRPKKKDLHDLLGNASSIYTADITPLILAAHKDNYQIIKILLDQGDVIPKPHDLRCSCHECVKSQKEDSLKHSRSRINSYKALASPSLICLSSKDPILTAFELSWELKRLGKLENEFKEDYENLSLQCQKFATDLVAQTRGYTELTTILNHDHGHVITSSVVPIKDEKDDENVMTLSRLKLGIKYKQKRFIAHPHCQQLLASLWNEGLPGLRRLSFINQSCVIGLICVMFPVISISYLISPRCHLGSLLKKPFIKFVCHQSSYIFFLILITISSMKLEYVIFGGYEKRLRDRGPFPSLVEWPILIYILGFVWQEMKQLYSSGLKTYMSNMWNLLDFGTNALYVSTVALRVTACIHVYQSTDRFVYRGDWESFEPILISECLFAGANIISTIKLVFLFTISPTLGPLQISLGRMLGDILSFFSLYLLVLIAYAIGFHEVYWFYSHERGKVCKNMAYTYQSTGQDLERYQYCTTRGRYFSNIFEIVQALYWSVYGLIDVSNLNLEHAHAFTEFIGKLMFGSFSYITIIMLLNMFIAMMNNSYQIISEKSDMEWKFARSKFWISYFEEGGTVPVPFNIIPSPKSFYYCYVAIKNILCGCTESHNRSKWKSIRKLVKKVNEKETRHLIVMKDLIKRYLMNRQRNAEDKGVTDDDLNEIKNDISSFRFELMETLKMNGMKTPEYLNKPGGKLRKKGSKKGFSGIVRQLNTFKSKEDSAPIFEEADSSLKGSDVNYKSSKSRTTCFNNEGFEDNNEVFTISNTLFTEILKEDYASVTPLTKYSYIAQPLNASDLLQVNSFRPMVSPNPSDSSCNKIDKEIDVSDHRYDMV